MRLFRIFRAGFRTPADVLGEGVVYRNGWASIMWNAQTPHMSTHSDIESVMEMYGNQGLITEIVFVGEETDGEMESTTAPDLALSLRRFRTKEGAVASAILPSGQVGLRIGVDEIPHFRMGEGEDLASEDLLLRRYEDAMAGEFDAMAATNDRMMDTFLRYEHALATIRSEYGLVCDEFEICSHPACQSSHASWDLANNALDLLPDGEDEEYVEESPEPPTRAGGDVYRMGVSLTLALNLLTEISERFQHGDTREGWEELVERVQDVLLVIEGALQTAPSEEPHRG